MDLFLAIYSLLNPAGNCFKLFILFFFFVLQIFSDHNWASLLAVLKELCSAGALNLESCVLCVLTSTLSYLPAHQVTGS